MYCIVKGLAIHSTSGITFVTHFGLFAISLTLYTTYTMYTTLYSRSHSTPHQQYPHSSSTYSGSHSGGRFSHDMDMDLGLYGNEGLFDELEGLDGPQRYVVLFTFLYDVWFVLLTVSTEIVLVPYSYLAGRHFPIRFFLFSLWCNILPFPFFCTLCTVRSRPVLVGVAKD